MPWFTQGVLANPAINVVLADSGPVLGSSVLVTVMAAAQNAGRLVLERRNVANDATLGSQIFAVTAEPFTPLVVPVPVNDGERVRIITQAAFTGAVQASLFV